MLRLNRNKRIVLSVAILLLIAVFVKTVMIDIVYVNQQYEKHKIITPWGEKIKSGNLSVDYSIDQVMADIDTLGLNTVNVPVEIDISSLTASTMTVNEGSKKKAVELIKKLRYKGINVILEPYPFIQKGELYETKLNPVDINEWFWNWKQIVLRPLIQEIAKPYKVYALCLGSNFDQFEDKYDYWADVADFVRMNYQGRMTYKTNWWFTAEWDKQQDRRIGSYSLKLNNPILQKVDFISVAAYFELTAKETNTADELEKLIYRTSLFDRHQNVYEELKNLSAQWNKPVFFGELGFPKRNGAAVHPWNPLPSQIVNEQEQANGFEAYKRVFEKESWNLGFSVFAVGKKDELKNYYPSEQSIQVIKSWYRD